MDWVLSLHGLASQKGRHVSIEDFVGWNRATRDFKKRKVLVSEGSYIVANDGVMSAVADAPRGESGWVSDNPTEAVREFAEAHPEFAIEQPQWPFNESELSDNITHWPGAWLKRCGYGDDR